MKITIICLALLISHSAFATVWITIADPQGQKIGVVGASSGYIGDYRTMVPVDNQGIAVVGSWYLGKKQKHLVKLINNEALTASELVKEFSWLINQDSKSRRVSFVNSRFENASEPGRGCHSHNHYCGKYVDPMFSITGGGLIGEHVILAGKDAIQNNESMPMECRMYLGMKAIFKSGGEFKTIERLSFVVDDLRKTGDNKITLFKRKGHENSLLAQFAGKLKAMGFNCGF